MYITPEEINTHLNVESVEAISDGDETLLQAAIDGAIVETKSYLSGFDVATEFSKSKTEGTDYRNPLLIIFLKDIIVWHFINICNVNISMDIRQDRYNRAIAWLKSVQKGEVNPDLPALTDGEKVAPITYSSNSKRENHY